MARYFYPEVDGGVPPVRWGRGVSLGFGVNMAVVRATVARRVKRKGVKVALSFVIPLKEAVTVAKARVRPREKVAKMVRGKSEPSLSPRGPTV